MRPQVKHERWYLAVLLLTLLVCTGLPTLSQPQQRPRLVVQTGHTGSVYSVAFSPDGKTLVSGGDKTIKVWNIATGKEVNTLQGHTDYVWSLAFSSDGKTLASGSYDKTIKLWNVETGKLLSTLQGHTGGVYSVVFSPDGKTLASGEYKIIKLWNVETGKEINTLQGHTANVYSVVFSPDGKTLASGSMDKTIKLWNVETGKEISTFLGHTEFVHSLAFSSDGKILASGSMDTTIKLWNVETGKLLNTLQGHTSVVHSVVFSPDGKTLASGSWDHTIKLWNGQTGKLLNTLQGHTNWVYSVVFSPDGKTLASGSADTTIKVWNIETGQLLNTLQGHTQGVQSVAFSSDGKTLASGSRDSTIRLWNAETGKELCSLVSFGEQDWAVVTPDSRFDGTPDGLKQLHWVQNNKPYPLASFFEGFFTPHLLAHVTANDTLPPPRFDIAQGVKPTPLVTFTSPQPGQTLMQERITLTIQATDTGGGVEGIRLYHNGKLVSEDAKRLVAVSADTTLTRTFTVPLVKGDNAFRAVAYNHDRVESYPAELTVTCTRAQPTAELYLLAVGVSHYQNTKFNLDYPTDDAQAFVQALTGRGQSLFKQIHPTLLLDKDVTQDKIGKAFAAIIAQARPQDVFVFYYSGHGAMSTAQAGTPADFYLVCSDVVHVEGADGLTQRGVSAHQLKDWCVQVQAQKQLLLLDACQSGGAAPLFALRGLGEEEALAQLAHSTGVAVLSASLREQSAGEYRELKHGLFTYVLLAGLNGEAGKPDGKITPSKLKGYLEVQVPLLGKKFGGEAQYPTGRIDGQDFPIAVIANP